MTGLRFLPNYKITKIRKDIVCLNIVNCLTFLTEDHAGDLPGWAGGLLASCVTDLDKADPHPE